jgi:hypothetical protein
MKTVHVQTIKHTIGIAAKANGSGKQLRERSNKKK